jgi:deoxyribodipyrimidine photo-lyase
MSVSIVWFRNDLRLSDNPALIKALESGHAVVPVFVLDGETDGVRPPGAASRWWLHYSLHALDSSLRRLGSRLILRRGPAAKVLGDLATETGAASVFWNRAYDRGCRERDTQLKKALSDRGVTVESFNANLLFEPWEITSCYAACPQESDGPKVLAGQRIARLLAPAADLTRLGRRNVCRLDTR